MSNPVQDHSFRSGVAARLAGIPVETLRVWERRYKISGAKSQGASQRLYSRADIHRLTLLKRLVDLGQSIGTLSQMESGALESMQNTLLGLSRNLPEDLLNKTIQVGLIGATLACESLRAAITTSNLSIGFFAQGLEQTKTQAITGSVDILLVEIPTIMETSVSDIDQLSKTLDAKKIILFYRFAPNTIIRQLRLKGCSVVRTPVDAHEVIALCRSILSQPAAQGAPKTRNANEDTPQGSPPAFSEASLARFTQMKSSVYCECPSQLAELLLSVTAFEHYSAQCANKSPSDAALHQSLETAAADARRSLEQALKILVEAEGLSVEH